MYYWAISFPNNFQSLYFNVIFHFTEFLLKAFISRPQYFIKKILNLHYKKAAQNYRLVLFLTLMQNFLLNFKYCFHIHNPMFQKHIFLNSYFYNYINSQLFCLLLIIPCLYMDSKIRNSVIARWFFRFYSKINSLFFKNTL
jgi:hypothetical protein